MAANAQAQTRERGWIEAGVAHVASGVRTLGRFSARQYFRARGAAGKTWAPLAPAMLVAGEIVANNEVPAIERAGAVDDMVIASSGAAALGAGMTLTLKGMGVNVERPGVKRFVEATSTAFGAAGDLLMRVEISGTDIAHNPVPTAGSTVVALAAAALGSMAGNSTGRALAR
ncbi:MAG TPA: hypothetical protein VL737_01765 [Candidatus Pristimantibacillus sp.]|nr:hypothetical protein [Candidatus Pristimantibacillus sp.]